MCPPIRQPGRCAVTTSSPIFCSDNHVQESPYECLENIVCPQQWPTTTEVQNVKTKMLDIAAQACCVYATAWHAQSQRRIPHLRPNPNPCFLSPRWTPWRGPVLGALGAWTLHETRPHAWTPTMDNPTRPLCIKAFPVGAQPLISTQPSAGPTVASTLALRAHPPRLLSGRVSAA